MLYFSYGSNMSSRRLQARTPSAQFVSVAALPGHQLRFHKKSDRDGSGKCDIHATNIIDDIVYGVVFRLAADEIEALDRAEGLGAGYDKKQVGVTLAGGADMSAFTYFATDIADGLSPLCWYKEHVVRGAREHGLPADYVAVIEAVAQLDDADNERRVRELSIYRQAGG